MKKMSHFAGMGFGTALRGLRDCVDSLLRRDGHPSRLKPQGQRLPETGIASQAGDERAAIAANLFHPTRCGLGRECTCPPTRCAMKTGFHDGDSIYMDMSFCTPQAGPMGGLRKIKTWEEASGPLTPEDFYKAVAAIERQSHPCHDGCGCDDGALD